MTAINKKTAKAGNELALFRFTSATFALGHGLLLRQTQ